MAEHTPSLTAPRGRSLPGILLDGWDRLACWLVIVMMSAMVGVVALQVFMRYGLNNSLAWADEVARLAFVWVIFLAIPLGLGTGAHIGIELLTDRLPTAARQWLSRAVAVLGALLMLLVAWESVILAYQQWDERMGSVDASAGWFVAAVAVGAAHSGAHLLWIAITGAARGTVLSGEHAS